nr:uncharacterized protein LOC119178669 isoform X7 [Rhipicephalus microplus]
MTTPASGKGIPDLASTSTRKVLQEQDVIGAMNVDIKVERSSPPTLPPPWLICVGIKEEPVIPPTTESLDVNVDIKVEQSSPPTTPLPDMSVDVKVEPRSPTATPPPHASEGSLKGLPSTPHLAVIGSSMADINKIVLVMDQEEYISTTSFEKALGLLLGAFFVWNIAYPSGCPLTLEFLQRYIGQINPTKGRGKGKGSGIPQRVLSLLKAL